jgi:CheY-like chemotaxis protein
MMLTKAGYRVDVAHNGREAVDMLTTDPDRFDLVFMDIQMPKMDGIRATQTIRQRGFSRLPIVAMTANAMQGDREKCIEAGMNDYVTKPIRKNRVLTLIEKWTHY